MPAPCFSCIRMSGPSYLLGMYREKQNSDGYPLVAKPQLAGPRALHVQVLFPSSGFGLLQSDWQMAQVEFFA